MEGMGRSADGKRVVVELTWDEVQALLNSAVGESDRTRRQGKRQGLDHLTRWADFALETGNKLEACWMSSARQTADLQQVGQQVPQPKITITPVARPKIIFHRVSLGEDGEVVVDEEGSTNIPDYPPRAAAELQQVGPHEPNYRYEAS